MRVISRRRLREFWEVHPDAEPALKTWWKLALSADWANIRDVRVVYPHADAVRLASGAVVTVFNIAGNKFRLIVRIIYPYRRIYVKHVLTHADYDLGLWRSQLCRE
jgi:mRNA interferase HigB